ncbi:MAG: DUF1990 domain-containing protein [Pirellulaceae bacterium]|nr:DUF1990 domain-containing protein [Pirellulaceae bacterium]
MLRIFRPSDDAIREFLARQAGKPWSYDLVGVTRDGPPPARRGWNIDHERVLLGHGEPAFRAAAEAIARWQMFPPQIAKLCWPDAPQTPGTIVGVLYWAAPCRLWLLFPAQVVYQIDEQPEGAAPAARFGFAYGTVVGHPEAGEERFLVEWNRADDTVWYDLLAVSRPAHPLTWLGYPYTRWEQARFRRQSCAAMERAVATGSGNDQ